MRSFPRPAAEADRADRFVRGAVDAELREGQIQSVEVDRGCSILAEVGDSVAGARRRRAGATRSARRR